MRTDRRLYNKKEQVHGLKEQSFQGVCRLSKENRQDVSMLANAARLTFRRMDAAPDWAETAPV